MSWQAIAIKDFQDAIRTRSLLVLTVLLALFIGAATFTFDQLLGAELDSTAALALALAGPSAFLVPILALLVSYRAIAGERSSGSIRFVLGLPHTRWEVIVGKFVGRSAVVAVAVFVGFAVGAVVAVFFATFHPLRYLAFVLLTLVLGAVYVAVGTGLSATTRSPTRAGVLVFFVFIVFEYLWGVVGLALLYIASGFSIDFQELPGWYEWFAAISPSASYQYAMWELVPGVGDAGAAMETGGTEIAYGTLPFWVPILVLAAWITVPLALGRWRFDRVDIT